MRKKPRTIRSGNVEFLKLNAEHWEWRDLYQSLLSFSWPEFVLFIASIYIGLNLIFAALYLAAPGCINGLPPHSFVDAFFFSVQTLATVGYGHWYPDTIYGHIVSTMEIVVGVFGLAVMTGLIFVRFSRPIARIVFSQSLVISPLKGKQTLMVRIGNLHQESMVEAEFRVMFARNEPVEEDDSFRFFYPLKLHFDRLAAFPAALTLRHTIDESSPLYGATFDSLQAGRAVFVVSVAGVDPVIPAAIQTHRDYTWRDVRFGHRFAEMYLEEDNKLTVDFARIHDTQPIKE
jgi:inward rectifier potassium channel